MPSNTPSDPLPRIAFLPGIAIVILLMGAGAAPRTSDADLTKFDWSAEGNQLTFHAEFSRPVIPQIFDKLLEKKYFYVDFYGVAGPADAADWDLPQSGLKRVKRLYYPQYRVLRFVFYAVDGEALTMSMEGLNRSYFVRVVPLDLKPLDRTRREDAKGTRKIVILDPGHGGTDNGAQTSKPVNGKTYYEKDIVLQIVRRIVALAERSPNLEIHLTRAGDQHVSLEDRIAYADRQKGDLFVSIHLNASDERGTKTARGFEVYYLSDGSKETNRQLEHLENRQGVNLNRTVSGDENLGSVLRNLADDKLRERRKESLMAGLVFEQVLNHEGPFKARDRGVKTAAFRVLMNFNMPSILVECGFIDNAEDAKLLAQSAVQDQIAALLFNGINLYFARMDPQFEARLAPTG